MAPVTDTRAACRRSFARSAVLAAALIVSLPSTRATTRMQRETPWQEVPRRVDHLSVERIERLVRRFQCGRIRCTVDHLAEFGRHAPP